ncbi:MAG: alpha amylase C-terminal domain-containing protein [Bacteroidales bacterium]|nr:alpha amylase C-terminal domain-containing protein [Bacteroidales bacterium]
MIYEEDALLLPFKPIIDCRHEDVIKTRRFLAKGHNSSLFKSANNYLYYGLHRQSDGSWIFREWAPNATRIYLIGDFNNFKRTDQYALTPVGEGTWEIHLPEDAIHNHDLYKLFIEWPGGGGERIPSYCRRAVQDDNTKIFCAQVWENEKPYKWRYKRPGKVEHPLIYECHIGMSGEEEKISTFNEFRSNVLPYIKELGYNVIQIMALQEHPYYGSFGYQVANFYALSSRFGTPDDFKLLVDEAHRLGITVIMDLVHSHSVSNVNEGLSHFDGRDDIYFHTGSQGYHPAWNSRCFNYGKSETQMFLLSNIKFWMEEYRIDGFRFDGVTSMIYWDHGLGRIFMGYEPYFDMQVDNDALIYLTLANILIHEIHHDALTIAEDVSGMPGMAAPFECGGIGFDFRMAMGIADNWIKWIKELRDENWSMGEIWYQLTNKRKDEKTISYAECHDQAMVGDKTLIFRLMDKEMYTSMNLESKSFIIDRGMALHKMIRLATLATSGGGYLTFMGNEFGHPEWIDFPREGNNWSYKYARRQWDLMRADYLRYRPLMLFDADMIKLIEENDILSSEAELLTQDEQKKVLVFRRGDYIFAFNFNPSQSFTGYGFSAPDGNWKVIMDSDEKRYNGYQRLSLGEEHNSIAIRSSNGNQNYRNTLYLYLPSRVCVVLKKIK